MNPQFPIPNSQFASSKPWITAWGKRILFLLVFGVLPLLAAKPVYRYAKLLRAQSYWRAARKADARNDWAEVQRLVQLGLMLRPDLPDGYRVYAQLMDAHDPALVGRSIALWRQVLQMGHPTPADRVAFGRAALREGLLNEAGQQAAILLKDKHPDNEVYNFAGLVALQFKEITGAQFWFKKVLEHDPRNLDATLYLAQTELFFGKNDTEMKQGMDRLRPLFSRTDNFGLESLRLLVQWGGAQPNRFPSQQAEFVAKLKTHPLARITDQCLAAEWEIKRLPTAKKKEEALENLVQQSPKLPPDEKRELALWFNHFGWYEKTLEAFPPNPRDPEPLLLTELDAMALLKQWDKLDQFLTQNLFPSQPVVLWVFRARAARELGQERQYELSWDRALEEAGRDPASMEFLADYAEKMGDLQKAIEMWESLSQQSVAETDSLLKLIPLYSATGQTRLLLQTMQRLSLLYPKEESVLNDMAYLGLLLDDPTTRSLELAKQVYVSNPHLPAFALTYALALFKGEKAADALDVIRKFPAEAWSAPGWQAVYAAILKANGQKAEAARIVGKIDQKLLKPEERQLVEGIVR